MSTPATILTLKVYIETTGQTKTLRFSGDEAVAEIIKEIREKTNEGGADFGIFVPANPVTKAPGQWLERNRALRFYNIKNDYRIEYKKRHRPLPVRTVDGAEKKILVDDGANARQLSDTVGEKLGLGKHAEQFGLAFPGSTHKNPKWFKEAQTLHEQGYEPGTTLEYLKRYSVMDAEVSSTDSHVLHLLYMTTAAQIIQEVYPITRNDARDFAALQLQITFGDHNPEKHKPGFADLSLFLPPPFLKSKEKEEQKRFYAEIYRDHKKLKGCKDNVAKTRYIQLARSLKTYGYTFFDCVLQTEEPKAETPRKKLIRVPTSKKPEKPPQMVKKNVKTTFGVSLAKLCLYDYPTNQFTEAWPFAAMKQWDVFNDVCAIDFSTKDIELSLKLATPDAEVIAETIAGYITIILRLKKEKGKIISNSSGDVGEIDEGDEDWGETGLTLMSSYLNPALQGAGQGTFMGAGGGPGNPGSQTQREANMTNVNNLPSALRAAKLLSKDLASGKGAWGKKGALTEENWQKQFERNRTQLADDMKDFLGACTLVDGKLDRKQLDIKCTAMHMNVASLVTAARNLAVLNEDNVPLLDGAKALCDSLADLMSLVMNSEVTGDYTNLADILAASQKQFAAANLLLQKPVMDGYVDEGTKLLLLNCIGAVDTQLKSLLKTARNENQKLTPEEQKILENECKKVEAIKGMALSTMANLVPHLANPQALVHIHHANDTLHELLDGLQGKYKATGAGVTPPLVLSEIEEVETALKNLFEASKAKEHRAIEGNIDIVTPAVQLLNSLAGFRAAVNAADPYRMNKETLEQEAIAKQLVATIRKLAPQIPALKTALEVTADTIANNMEALSKESHLLQSNPQSSPVNAVGIVSELENHVQNLISSVGQQTAVNNLRYEAKNVAANMIRLISSSKAADDRLAKAQRDILLRCAKDMSKSLNSLLGSLQIAAENPDDVIRQQALQEGVKKQLPGLHKFVDKMEAVTAASPADLIGMLPYETQQGKTAVDNLEKASHRIDEMQGNLLITQALGSLDLVKADLETASCFAEQGRLAIEHNLSVPQALEKLAQAISRVKVEEAHLINAAKNGNKESWPDTILATSEAVEKVAQIAILTARALPERLAQTRVLASGLKSLNDTHDLIAASRVLVHNPKDAPAQRVLGFASQLLHHDLESIRTSATGFNPSDLEQAQKLLMTLKAAVEVEPNLEGQADLSRVHKLAAAKLKPAARAVNLPLASFVNTAEALPSHIGYEAKVTVNSIGNLLSLTNILAFTAPDQKTKEEIMAVSRLICDEVGALLKTSNEIAMRAPGAVDQADAISKQILNTINNTLWATVKAAPSSSADAAVTRIMDSLLDNEPGPYGLTKEEVVKDLQQGVTGLRLLLQSVPKEAANTPEQAFFCEKAAQLIEDIIFAARLAQASDGTKPLLTAASLKVLDGVNLLEAHSTNKPFVDGVVQKIAALAPYILDASKEGIASTPTEEGRQKLIVATRAVGVALNRLTEENKAGCTPEATRLNAASLKEKLLVLQAELNDPLQRPHVVVSRNVAEEILMASKGLAVPTTTVLRSTAGAPGADLGAGLKDMHKNLDALQKVCTNLQRSNEERAKAIQAMQKASADLDTTLLFASIGLLESGEKTKIQATQVAAKDICKQTGIDMKQLVTSVKTGQPKDLYEAAVGFQHSIPKFVEQINLVAAQMDNEEKVTEVLEQSKKFSESLKDLTEYTTVINTAEPATVKTFGANFQTTSAELAKLLTLLNTGVQAQNKLDEAIAAINTSLQTLDKPVNNGDFDACNQRLQAAARDVGSAMTLLLNAESEEQVLNAATRIQAAVPALIEASRAATHAAKQPSAKDAIQTNATAVGTSVLVGLEKVKGILVGSGEKPQLLRAFQQTNKALAAILSSSSSDLNDVEAMVLDRAAGQLLESLALLNAEKINIVSGISREAPTNVSVLDLAKTIDAQLQQLKPLAAQLKSEQSHTVLAQTGKNLSSNVANIITPSINAVSRLPPQDQVPFIEALSDVVLTSSKLVLAGKAKFKDPQAVNQIAQEEKHLADQIAKVKSILAHLEEQNATTSKKLKNDISAVEKANKGLSKATKGKPGATPAELKHAAKQILATVEGIKAAQTDDEATKLSAQLPSELENLYSAALGAPENADLKNLLDEFLAAARASGDALLGFMNINANLPPRAPASVAQNKAVLAPSSQQVVTNIGGLVDLIKKIPVEKKSDATLKELTVDPNDLEAFAESELLKCAAAIKEAAALLIKAAPPKKSVSVGLDTADINEAILEAARSIAAATGNLIQCAAVSQAERKEEAKKKASKYFADPNWSNGLVSAAQAVASQVKALVEAANKSAGGAAEEERLIACARAVATTTIHLVTASRTKSDPASSSQRNLSKASVEVTVSTGQLVVAANAAATLMAVDEEEDFTKLNFAAASGIRAQMEQRGKIDKLERELREMRQELLNIRRARYQKEK